MTTTNPAVQEMIDPANEFVKVSQRMSELAKLLRPVGTIEGEKIIKACQEIKRNISYIEDWAFRYGNSNG